MTDKIEKQDSKKSPQQNEKKDTEVSKTMKGIVRLAGKDIHGEVRFKNALRYVRGIGYNLSESVANLISKELRIKSNMLVGDLTDEQIEKIDHILFNLSEYNLPKYLLNRRADVFDGTNKHVIMNDLIFENSQDIEKEKKSYSWKGYRHAYGQKVRGQRTRNTGRSGMAVGVLRKAILQQQAAAGAAGKGAVAPAGGGAAAAPAAGGAKVSAPAGGPKKTGPAAPTVKPAEKK